MLSVFLLGIARPGFAGSNFINVSGDSVTINGQYNAFVGYLNGNTLVTGNENSAFGFNSGGVVNGNNNSAFGNISGNNVTGDNNVAFGSGAGSNISASSTVSIGDSAKASQNNAIAIGTSSAASGVEAIAIGKGASATGSGGTALGDGAVATTAGGVALGKNSVDGLAQATSSATVGGVSYSGFAGTTPSSVVSVGSAGNERQITNVAAGQITATSTDAVNGSQLYSLAQTASTGWQMTTGATSGTTGQAAGTSNEQIQPGETVTYGAGNNIIVSQSGNAVSYGLNSALTNITSMTAGDTLINTNGVTITGGPSVTKSGIDASSQKIVNVADGLVATGSKEAVNGGQLQQASSDLTHSGLDFSDAGGNKIHSDLGSTLTLSGSIKQVAKDLDNTGMATAGSYSAANVQTYADAASGKLQVQFADAPEFSGKVTAQSFAVAGNKVSLSVSGLDNGGQKIVNVADGTIAANSKEAVNGGQLYTAINNSINNVNLTFGANDADTVTRQNGDTLLIKGGAVTTGAYSGNNIRTDADPATGAINIQMADSPKFGNVVINDGDTGKITGVSAGTLSSSSTDAINGSQLYETNERVAGLDNRIDHVGAMSAALSGIQAGTFIESSPTQVGVGGGAYNGKVAIAAGVNHYTSKCVLFNAGAAFSGGEVMGRAGVTIALGTAPKKRPQESPSDVDQLRNVVRQQNSQIQGLMDRINNLELKTSRKN